MLSVVSFLLVATFLFKTLSINYPSVLGISTDITSQELLIFLNQEREKNNLGTLSLNPELSAAAREKANDMFSKNYWSHDSPDGKTPWDFIKDSGYIYVYAGENLARGFTTSEDVTKAWMESPSHRENMLSSNYSDVGFAVVIGELDGEETVLVVQEFGSRTLAGIPDKNNANNISEASKDENGVLVASSQVKRKPFIDSAKLTSNIGILIIIVIIATLIAEVAILERRKITTFAKHNPDHVLFLISILILMLILGNGAVV